MSVRLRWAQSTELDSAIATGAKYYIFTPLDRNVWKINFIIRVLHTFINYKKERARKMGRGVPVSSPCWRVSQYARSVSYGRPAAPDVRKWKKKGGWKKVGSNFSTWKGRQGPAKEHTMNSWHCKTSRQRLSEFEMHISLGYVLRTGGQEGLLWLMVRRRGGGLWGGGVGWSTSAITSSCLIRG